MSFPWSADEINRRLAKRQGGISNANIINLFYEGVLAWVAQSENNKITSQNQIEELWESYLTSVPAELKERAQALTSLVVNTSQILPKTFNFVDVLRATLLISVPNILCFEKLDLYFRGSRLDEILGRVVVSERSMSGDRTLTEDGSLDSNSASRQTFEDWVIENEIQLNPSSQLEAFAQYVQPTTVFDKYTIAACALQYIDMFEVTLITLLQDPALAFALEAGQIDLPKLIEGLNERCTYYLNAYLQKKFTITPSVFNFQGIIAPVLRNGGAGFISSSTINVQETIAQYVKHVKSNLSLGIAPAITIEERERQLTVFPMATTMRDTPEDQRDGVPGAMYFDPNQSISAIVPSDQSFRVSQFNVNALQSAASSFSLGENNFSEIDSASEEQIYKHVFTSSNENFISKIDQTHCPTELYSVALQRLWNAYITDSRCPQNVKTLLEKGRQQDQVFLARVKRLFVESGSDESQQLANIMQAVATLWMYPDILTKIGLSKDQQQTFHALQLSQGTTRVRLCSAWVEKHKLSKKILAYQQKHEATLKETLNSANRAGVMQAFIPLLLKEAAIQERGFHYTSRILNNAQLDLIIIPQSLTNIFGNLGIRLEKTASVEKELLSVVYEAIQIILQDFKTVFSDVTQITSMVDGYDKAGEDDIQKKNLFLLNVFLAYAQPLYEHYSQNSNQSINAQFCSVAVKALCDFINSAQQNQELISSVDFYTAFQNHVNHVFDPILSTENTQELKVDNFQSSYRSIGVNGGDEVQTLTQKVLSSAVQARLVLNPASYQGGIPREMRVAEMADALKATAKSATSPSGDELSTEEKQKEQRERIEAEKKLSDDIHGIINHSAKNDPLILAEVVRDAINNADEYSEVAALEAMLLSALEASSKDRELYKAIAIEINQGLNAVTNKPKIYACLVKMRMNSFYQAASHNENDRLNTLAALLPKAVGPRDAINTPTSSFSTKTYEDEFFAALDAGDKPPKYYNDARIQAYLLKQLAVLEENGKMGGAESIRNILNSNLPFQDKLKMLAAIGSGKSNNSWASKDHLGRLLRPELGRFYEGLKRFSDVHDEEEISRALTGFLKDIQEIDSSVDHIEHYIQRNILLREGMRGLSSKQFNSTQEGKQAEEKWRKFNEKPFSHSSLSIYEKIRSYQRFIQNLDNNFELRAAISHTTTSTSAEYTNQFKRWVQYSVNNGVVVEPTDLALIGARPMAKEIKDCHDIIQETIDVSVKSETAPVLTDASLPDNQRAALSAALKRTCISSLRDGQAIWEEVLNSQAPSSSMLVPQPAGDDSLFDINGSQLLGALLDEKSSLVAQINHYARQNTPATSEQILQIKEDCSDEQLKSLAKSLEQFRGLTRGSKYFAINALPAGMQTIVDMINSNKNTIDILLKLKEVAENADKRWTFGARDSKTQEAYKAINAFFAPATSDNLNDSFDSNREIKAKTMAGLIEAIDGAAKSNAINISASKN